MSRRSLVSSSVDNVESMHQFFHDWMNRQESVLIELQRSVSNSNSEEERDSEETQNELVQRVTAQYNEYYHAKSRVAHDNVFLVVDKFVCDLSEEQKGMIEEVRKLTKDEEKELADELARIQETVAAPPVVELARRAARAVDGELVDLEGALGTMRSVMETLVECADFLRFRTVMRILSVLKCGQSVKFFTGLTQFQVQIRRWETLREAAAAP